MKNNISKFINLHKKVVQQVLDETDIPFAEVRTYQFKDGEYNRNKKRKMEIKCNQGLLISSYIEYDGHTIRISNHEKSGSYPEGMTNYIYDETGTVIKACNYPKEGK